MSVTINGSPLKNLPFNQYSVKKWFHNGILVWQKYIAGTASITRGSLQEARGKGWLAFPSYNFAGNSLNADAIIDWYYPDSTQARGVKAKGPCTITVSGTIQVRPVDGPDAWTYIRLCRNDTAIKTWYNGVKYAGVQNRTLSPVTITMDDGDTCHVEVYCYNDSPTNRTAYTVSSPITFVATPP